MTTRLARTTTTDPALDALIEQVADALQAGEPVDLEALARRDPGRAEQVRRLLPAIAMMADLGRSIALESGPGLGILGDFRIVREVGRGGMGVVYEAEQVSLGRRVALKVLPTASALDPRQLARFRLEAQAASHLHHPHIVPVYAVGSEGDVHYYAMQFIEGPSLAAVIGELRRRGEPRDEGDGPAAPVAEGLASGRDYFLAAAVLGVQAADALEHAHALGIVHRDIKPANLLADVRGHLWVADFGLARTRDGAELTGPDDLPGTLRYMSPEQARGAGSPVDHRADIYSLGATLFELLTLRPAFQGDDRASLLRRVALEEPRSPRRLEPRLPRDLETIVLKAMGKEPATRYGRAGELADDLRRFLDGRPIRARRPSPIALARSWARRHRAATAAAAAGLLLATVVGGALIWREKGRTESALADAQEARRREREALRFTFLASDRLAGQALARLAATGPPGGQDGELFRRSLAYYEEAAGRYRDDPDMKELEAASSHRVGFLRMVLGRPDAAEALARSVSLYEGLVGRTPRDARLRQELALALTDRALQLRAGRDLPASEQATRRMIEVFQGLADDSPEATDTTVCLAFHRLEFAERLEDAGRTSEAVDQRVRLRSLLGRAAATIPDDPRLQNNLAWALAKSPLATTDDAARAVAMATRAVALSPGERAYPNTLGVARYRAGDLDGAAEAFATSMQLRDGGDPYDWLFLAMIRRRQGDAATARTWFDRSLARIKSDPPDRDLARFRDEAAALLHPR